VTANSAPSLAIPAGSEYDSSKNHFTILLVSKHVITWDPAGPDPTLISRLDDPECFGTSVSCRYPLAALPCPSAVFEPLRNLLSRSRSSFTPTVSIFASSEVATFFEIFSHIDPGAQPSWRRQTGQFICSKTGQIYLLLTPSWRSKKKRDSDITLEGHERDAVYPPECYLECHCAFELRPSELENVKI